MKSNIHYKIREDFKPRSIANTRSENNPDYWNQERVSMSGLYSYSAYKIASCIIGENSSIKRVIDLGCGPGLKLSSLIHPHGVDITGVDQEYPISLCRKIHRFGHFIVDDFESGIPSSEIKGKFDLVMSVGVIEHLLDPDNLLSYIKKISHADTIVVLATCDRDIIQAKPSVESSNIEHVWEWTIREFSNYISSQGIIITEQRLDDYIKISYKTPASVSGYKYYAERNAQRHLITVVGKWSPAELDRSI